MPLEPRHICGKLDQVMLDIAATGADAISVESAVDIPAARKKFDEAGVRPEDIRTGDDLAKLPVLTKDELPDCPVATTVQVIGSKWKLLIMRNLLVRPWRFNELQ